MNFIDIDDGTGSIGKVKTFRDAVRFLLEKNLIDGTSRIYQPDKDNYISLEEKFGENWKSKVLELLEKNQVYQEDFNFENFEFFYDEIISYY